MSHVSDKIQPQDSVFNAGSSVSQASKSSKAKISALRIKAEFQEKRARQRFEAERQCLEQQHTDRDIFNNIPLPLENARGIRDSGPKDVHYTSLPHKQSYS